MKTSVSSSSLGIGEGTQVSFFTVSLFNLGHVDICISSNRQVETVAVEGSCFLVVVAIEVCSVAWCLET